MPQHSVITVTATAGRNETMDLAVVAVRNCAAVSVGKMANMKKKFTVALKNPGTKPGNGQ